MVTEGSLSSL